jgi:hypothetical protein
MHQPINLHLVAAIRILCYIQGTIDHGILSRPDPLSLTTFTDFDWVGDPFDKCSTAGLVVFLGKNPTTWQSKKQSTILWSSTEAKYRSLATDVAKLSWICVILWCISLVHCGLII